MLNKHKQKKKKNQDLQKGQQGAQHSNWKKNSEVCKQQEKEENRKRAPALSRNEDFWQWSKKRVSSLAESMEIGETSSSSSEWNLGSDKLFVTCLNDNSEN